jgi:hypothetical protein
VSSIGDYAFYGCSSLTDVYYAGSQLEWTTISIGAGNGQLTSAKRHCDSMVKPLRFISPYSDAYSGMMVIQRSDSTLVVTLKKSNILSAVPIIYLATYTDEGQMESVTSLVGNETGDTIVYTAPVPTSQYKLFILDVSNGYAPMTAAYDRT